MPKEFNRDPSGFIKKLNRKGEPPVTAANFKLVKGGARKKVDPMDRLVKRVLKNMEKKRERDLRK